MVRTPDSPLSCALLLLCVSLQIHAVPSWDPRACPPIASMDFAPLPPLTGAPAHLNYSQGLPSVPTAGRLDPLPAQRSWGAAVSEPSCFLISGACTAVVCCVVLLLVI